MCSGLQGDETSRYPLKCLLHPFRCRRHFLFQKDFARFIQNAVVRPAIAEVHTNRELVPFENHVSIYPNSASLFHSRSPFHCALTTSNIGSVSHPAETGLLIPSVLSGFRPAKLYKNPSTEVTVETLEANSFEFSTTWFATQVFSTLSFRASGPRNFMKIPQ